MQKDTFVCDNFAGKKNKKNKNKKKPHTLMNLAF